LEDGNVTSSVVIEREPEVAWEGLFRAGERMIPSNFQGKGMKSRWDVGKVIDFPGKP
jgi:hypothetical protein